MTFFQRAVVVVTAVLVIVQLLYPPLHFVRGAGERPDLPVTAFRVLALLIAGATLVWISSFRRSAILVVTVAAVAFVSVSGWRAWQQARATAADKCREARDLAVGKMEWGNAVESIAVITAPDGSQWAEPSWGRIASGPLPRGWRVNIVPVPAIVVVEDKPPVHPQADSWNDAVSFGVVTYAGWQGFVDFSRVDFNAPPGSTDRMLSVPGPTGPMMSGLTSNLREDHPEYAYLIPKNILFVGGPGERLTGTFCSRSRLRLGW